MNMRRRRHPNVFSRYISTLSIWWIRVRFYWYRLNKTPLVVLSVALGVTGAVGFMLYTMAAESDERRSLTCLALNVYFEARGEPEAGQYAVAEVTLNRVASPYYPKTVCEVVYQKNWDPLRRRFVSAFSWTEFGSLPPPRGEEWQRARKIAEEVYSGRRPPRLAGALHYHADHIAPSWSRGKTPVASIGNHRFYK